MTQELTQEMTLEDTMQELIELDDRGTAKAYYSLMHKLEKYERLSEIHSTVAEHFKSRYASQDFKDFVDTYEHDQYDAKVDRDLADSLAPNYEPSLEI